MPEVTAGPVATTSVRASDKEGRSPARAARLVRALLAAACAASFGLALAACGSESGGSGSSDLAEMTWAVPSEFDRLDPTTISGFGNATTQLLTTEPLMVMDPNGDVRPNLAEASRPDPRTYVFKLHEGVTFSSGEPLTADDVTYSLRLHVGKGSVSSIAGQHAAVRSVETTGPNEVTVRLKAPDSTYEIAVARTPIVQQSAREAAGKAVGSPGALNVGTGPYVIERSSQDTVVLTRNEQYWGEKPEPKKLTLRFLADESAQLLAVRSGDLTGSFEIPPSQAEVYAKGGEMKLLRGDSGARIMLSMNVTRKPWDDVHVRRAIAYAIDKQGLVDALLRGNGQVAATIVSPASMRQLLPQDAADDLFRRLDRYQPDLERAKAELAKSSVPNGFSDEIVASDAEPDLIRVAQAVAQDVAELGIQLKVRQMPSAAYHDAVFFGRKATIAVSGFTTDSPDPMSIINYLANSINRIDLSGYTNLAEYENPAVDEVLEQYRRLPRSDKAGRAQLVSQALEILSDDQPYVPLAFPEQVGVIKNDLAYPGFNGFWWMTRWPDLVASAG